MRTTSLSAMQAAQQQLSRDLSTANQKLSSDVADRLAGVLP